MPEPIDPLRPNLPGASRFAMALGIPLAGIALVIAVHIPRAERPVLAQDPGPTSTPTLPVWEPSGRWRAVHAPKVSPLFPALTTPQGLNAVHGIERPGGGYFAMAVGDKCAIATYDGTAWKRDKSFEPQCNGVHTVDLRDVFVRTPEDIWVAARYTGGSGVERDCVIVTPASRDDVDFDEGCGLMAHWNGTAWRVQSNLDMRINRLAPPINAIDMIYDDASSKWFGWAVGNDAAFDSIKAIILQYVDGPDGGKWSLTAAPNNNAVDLRDVHLVSATEAWAVGEHGAEAWYDKVGDGPADWSRRGLSGPDHLYTVDLTDQLYGWDGGQRGRMNHYDGNCHDTSAETACWFDNKAYPVGPAGGQPITSIEIRGLDLLAHGVGWLVGTQTDSSSLVAYLLGDRWIPVPVLDDPDVNLDAVFMRNADQGWAVGDKGVILEYRSAGAPTATASPPASPTRTPTALPSATPTGVPSPSPAATDPGPSPTAATQVPSGQPTTATPPTATPTAPPASPTASPTATVEPSPTPSPTPRATATEPPPPGTIYLPFASRYVRRR